MATNDFISEQQMLDPVFILRWVVQTIWEMLTYMSRSGEEPDWDPDLLRKNRVLEKIRKKLLFFQRNTYQFQSCFKITNSLFKECFHLEENFTFKSNDSAFTKKKTFFLVRESTVTSLQKQIRCCFVKSLKFKDIAWKRGEKLNKRIPFSNTSFK